MHLGHCAVELHVAFADVAAVLDCFDAFADVVGLHCAGVDGCLGDEDYGGAGEGGGELRAHDYGFDGGD